MKREKLLYLESLRGIAAIIVALFHAHLYFAAESPLVSGEFFARGYLMVDLFFVLSGFVIALSYHDRLKTRQDAVLFQVRRAFRLYPLHLMTLSAFVLFEAMLWQIWDAPLAKAFNDQGAWWANLFLVQALTEPVQTFNKPAWSISIEFITYGVFALVCLLAPVGKLRDGLAVLLVVGAGVFLAKAGSSDVTQGLPVLARSVFSFFLGFLIFRVSRHSRLPSWVAPIGMFIVVAAMISGFDMPEALYPLVFAAIIWSLVTSHEAGSLKSALSHPVLVRMGALSFGIYMWHSAVFWLLPVVISSAFGVELYIEPTHHDMILVVGPWAQTAMLIVGLVLTYALAAATYRLVEKPFNEMGRRVTTGAASGRPAVSGAGHLTE